MFSELLLAKLEFFSYFLSAINKCHIWSRLVAMCEVDWGRWASTPEVSFRADSLARWQRCRYLNLRLDNSQIYAMIQLFYDELLEKPQNRRAQALFIYMNCLLFCFCLK